MALYFVTGSLGGGKSLCAMSKIDEYLRKGRKIATNMNINLEYLCNPDNNYSRLIRVPDAPSVQDLKVIGMGSDTPGDGNHGLLVLDELGTWFNARDFADKSRKEVIKFCIHLRKRRWDVLFLVQDFTMVDKQMRGNITQFLVTCQASHDYWMFRPFPKFHIATIRLKSKIKTGTWWYRSTDLYKAYDTEQLYFTAATAPGEDDLFVDDELNEKEQHDMALNGLYHLLPPAYLGDDVRNQIRARHAALARRKRNVAAFWMLAVINFFAWAPHLENINSESDIAPVPAVAESHIDPQPAQTDSHLVASSWEEIYSPLRVKSHARFGRRTRYTFTHPDYAQVITDEDLADAGVKIKPEGPNQATLISVDGDMLTVFR